MGKGSSYIVRKIFHVRKDMGLGFYITDFFFRRILRQNAGTTWAVHHTSTIRNPDRIIRGKDVYPGDSPGVYINAENGITIKDYTNIGPNVGLVSANHDFIDNAKHTSSPPIEIGRFCWLGMGAVVLQGVVLGDYTIVGAGAIVTKSFPEGYCVLAGNPARVVKQLNRTECESFARSKA